MQTFVKDYAKPIARLKRALLTHWALRPTEMLGSQRVIRCDDNVVVRKLQNVGLPFISMVEMEFDSPRLGVSNNQVSFCSVTIVML
jgi:hypothetical protein